MCLTISGSTRRLKSILKECLSTEMKLATEKWKQYAIDNLVLCLGLSSNSTRLKSTSKKRLPSVLRLAIEEREPTIET